MAQSRSKRNYRQEYDRYQGKPRQIKNRSLRNQARRAMENEGKVSKGDGKDVDHRKPMVKGGSNSRSNLAVSNRRSNRSFPRTRRARMR